VVGTLTLYFLETFLAVHERAVLDLDWEPTVLPSMIMASLRLLEKIVQCSPERSARTFRNRPRAGASPPHVLETFLAACHEYVVELAAEASSTSTWRETGLGIDPSGHELDAVSASNSLR